MMAAVRRGNSRQVFHGKAWVRTIEALDNYDVVLRGHTNATQRSDARGLEILVLTSPGNDPMLNYMDYTGDDCYREFTPGQKTRMFENFYAYRASV